MTPPRNVPIADGPVQGKSEGRNEQDANTNRGRRIANNPPVTILPAFSASRFVPIAPNFATSSWAAATELVPPIQQYFAQQGSQFQWQQQQQAHANQVPCQLTPRSSLYQEPSIPTQNSLNAPASFNTASNCPNVFLNQELRCGKWSEEEEEYADLLIDFFEKGLALDCENGVTLRSFLSRKLHCAPMRISKKFAGKGIGKKLFIRGASMLDIPTAIAKLKISEANFYKACNVTGSYDMAVAFSQINPVLSFPQHHNASQVANGSEFPRARNCPTTNRTSSQTQGFTSGELVETQAGSVSMPPKQGSSVATKLPVLIAPSPSSGTLATLKTPPREWLHTAVPPPNSARAVITGHANNHLRHSRPNGFKEGESLAPDDRADCPKETANKGKGSQVNVDVTRDTNQFAQAPEVVVNKMADIAPLTKTTALTQSSMSAHNEKCFQVKKCVQDHSTKAPEPVVHSFSWRVASIQQGQLAESFRGALKPNTALAETHAKVDPLLTEGDEDVAPDDYAADCHPSSGSTLDQRKAHCDIPDLLAGFDNVSSVQHTATTAQYSCFAQGDLNTNLCTPTFTSRSFDEFHRLLGADLAPLTPINSEAKPGGNEKNCLLSRDQGNQQVCSFPVTGSYSLGCNDESMVPGKGLLSAKANGISSKIYEDPDPYDGYDTMKEAIPTKESPGLKRRLDGSTVETSVPGKLSLADRPAIENNNAHGEMTNLDGFAATAYVSASDEASSCFYDGNTTSDNLSVVNESGSEYAWSNDSDSTSRPKKRSSFERKGFT